MVADSIKIRFVANDGEDISSSRDGNTIIDCPLCGESTVDWSEDASSPSGEGAFVQCAKCRLKFVAERHDQFTDSGFFFSPWRWVLDFSEVLEWAVMTPCQMITEYFGSASESEELLPRFENWKDEDRLIVEFCFRCHHEFKICDHVVEDFEQLSDTEFCLGAKCPACGELQYSYYNEREMYRFYEEFGQHLGICGTCKHFAWDEEIGEFGSVLSASPTCTHPRVVEFSKAITKYHDSNWRLGSEKQSECYFDGSHQLSNEGCDWTGPLVCQFRDAKEKAIKSPARK